MVGRRPMADTSRGDYPNIPCSDCGKVGEVFIRHWGPLVPRGAVGSFDGECWQARMDDYNQGRPIRPLGIKREDTIVPTTEQ